MGPGFESLKVHQNENTHQSVCVFVLAIINRGESNPKRANAVKKTVRWTVFRRVREGNSPSEKVCEADRRVPEGAPKNPECESVQGFYFLPHHSSLSTKIRIREFWKVKSNSE